MLQNSELRGIFIGCDYPELLLLLYADDLCIFDYSVIGLQRKIDILSNFCTSWGIQVNMDKTEILVFRNGGILRSNEKWFIDGNPIQIATYYNYLGVLISNRLSWSKCNVTLVNKASKALFVITKLVSKFPNMPVNLLFKLFDTKIKPILLYGAEVWGYEKRPAVDRFYTNFCKYILGVGKHVSSNAILVECGKSDLSVDYHFKCISFWCKLLRMPDNRYPKQAYIFMRKLDLAGRHTWASNIRILLNMYGFGIIWLNQDMGDVSQFLYAFKQRLIDCDKQNISGKINESSRFEYYKQIMSLLDVEYYITNINSREIRKYLCLLRLHELPLKSNIRFKSSVNINVVCNMCDSNCTEDEMHFIFDCKAYAALRKKYIPNYSNLLNHVKYSRLLNCNCKKTLVNCAKYIKEALDYKCNANR